MTAQVQAGLVMAAGVITALAALGWVALRICRRDCRIWDTFRAVRSRRR